MRAEFGSSPKIDVRRHYIDVRPGHSLPGKWRHGAARVPARPLGGAWCRGRRGGRARGPGGRPAASEVAIANLRLQTLETACKPDFGEFGAFLGRTVGEFERMELGLGIAREAVTGGIACSCGRTTPRARLGSPRHGLTIRAS